MKKVVLIEDNQEMRENTIEILELAGYEVFAAANGKEGVTLAQNEKPDLIICDIMMPVLDGYGTLHMLSKNPETVSIPFIFLTAKAERSDFRKGMGMGADDYITKPFSDMDLLGAIEIRLKKNEIMRRDFENSLSGLNDFITQAKGLKELSQLSENREIKHYKKKNEVYSQGDRTYLLYFVIKGKIKTFQRNEDGKELISGMHSPGDFIGYIDLLQGTNHTETAEVLEDAELATIPKEDFLNLIYSNRDVAGKFIKLLSNHVRANEERLLKLAYDSVRMRVAKALVELHHKFNPQNDKKYALLVSRMDLANLVGTATESLIRTLSDFKDEKLIEIEGTKVTIPDVKKLENMRY